jgi:hypothetical protein
MLSDCMFATCQHTDNWAVLVCTSRFWFNYRHIANTLAVYRSVRYFAAKRHTCLQAAVTALRGCCVLTLLLLPCAPRCVAQPSPRDTAPHAKPKHACTGTHTSTHAHVHVLVSSTHACPRLLMGGLPGACLSGEATGHAGLTHHLDARRRHGLQPPVCK